MEFGVSIPHTGQLASPEYIREFCLMTEQAGWEGLWAIDHVVLPPHTESYYTLARKPVQFADNAMSEQLAPMYEMISTLLWVAGFTNKARLGTAVAVLPLRNPVLNARMLATLDVFSGGRLIYGVGAGWLKEEADAMQMPWDQRGARSEEQIALLRRIWAAEGATVDFQGRFYAFAPMDPEPRPLQKPGPPILIGGHSEVALERAGRIGDGWIASGMSAPRLAEHWARVRAAAEANGRDPEKLLLVAAADLQIGEEGPAEPISEVIERVRAYQEAGVHHLRIGPRVGSPKGHLKALQVLGEEVLPRFR
jgi:probable F420-dependent oxidoreductase